jgi:hypothetical protein
VIPGRMKAADIAPVRSLSCLKWLTQCLPKLYMKLEHQAMLDEGKRPMLKKKRYVQETTA